MGSAPCQRGAEGPPRQGPQHDHVCTVPFNPASPKSTIRDWAVGDIRGLVLGGRPANTQPRRRLPSRGPQQCPCCGLRRECRRVEPAVEQGAAINCGIIIAYITRSGISVPGLRQERCRGDFHFEPGSVLPMLKGQGHPAHQAPNP